MRIREGDRRLRMPGMSTPGSLLQPRFFALTESRELALATAREAGLELSGIEERSFEGGEFKLRPLESVRGRRVFVLQSLAGSEATPVAERLIRLLFLLSVLRDAGATGRTVLLPYLAFARKERRTQLRDPVNTRYVAQLLEAAGADHAIALDVHSPAAFDNAFRIPTDHLSALPMMVAYFAGRLGSSPLTVVSPDVGGIKRAQLFQESLEGILKQPVELAFLEKRRALGRVATGRLVGALQGRIALVVDDLCATGGTLIRAAERCREGGARSVHVAVTHAPMAAGIAAVAAADAVTEIVMTDSVGGYDQAAATIGPKVSVLPLAPLFGTAVRRILCGQPLAPLLTSWPVPSDP